MLNTPNHSFLYYSVMFIFGCSYPLISLLIPYYVAYYKYHSKDLALTFILFGTGCIIGGFVYKLLNRFFDAFRILTLTCISFCLLTITLYLFATLYLIYVCSLLLALSICCLQIGAHSCILETYGKDSAKQMQKCYGYFGVGNIVVPIIVSLFELETLLLFAIGYLFLGTKFYQSLKKDKEKIDEYKSTSEYLQSLKSQYINPQDQEIQNRPMKTSIRVWFYISVLVGESSLSIFYLLPLFGVQSHLFDKVTINMILAIAMICFTFFRFLFGWLNSTTVKILAFSSLALLISNILNFGLFFTGNFTIIIVSFPILAAISVAGVQPALLAAPAQHGIQVNGKTLSDVSIIIGIAYFVSSSSLSLLMSTISPFMLFIGIGFYHLSTSFMLFMLNKMLKADKKLSEPNKLKELQLFQIKKQRS